MQLITVPFRSVQPHSQLPKPLRVSWRHRLRPQMLVVYVTVVMLVSSVAGVKRRGVPLPVNE